MKLKYEKLIKAIATIVLSVLILQLFPAIVFGVQQSNTLQETNTEIYTENENLNNSTDSSSSTEIIGEILEKRTLNQKYFLQNDGTVLTAIYPMDVHYDLNGQLVDIDNSLEDTNEDDEMYQNKNNLFKVKFSKKSNGNNLVKLNIKNHNIKWSLLNSNKVNATKIENTQAENNKLNLNNISSGIVQYENILNNIDIQYNVISNSIKENIILKDKSAINQEISFEFKTDNLKMEKAQDGRIIFSEENKEEVLFFLESPYMYDAKEETSNDIEIELIKNSNNKYTITLKPNKKWLESEERVYPIVIDPTVETSLNYQNIQDTYIFNGDSGYPNRYNAHILRVGSNNTLASKNPTRSLIKFTLPNLNAGDQIVSAMLDICSYPDTSEWAPPTQQIQINVHKMTSDWSSSTASWSNLNNKYDSRITDYIKYNFDSNNQTKFYYFDITSIVKDWYVSGNNYGLMLKDNNEVYNASHSDAYFFSSDVNSTYINARPMVQIVYRNQTGIENYQTYHTQSIGRAGTIYTNDYNGNLVLTHYDSSTSGKLMPVTINHVYNTNNKDVDIGYGKGFRINLAQIISLVTINNVEYAKYIDEDATEHYFKRNGTSNTYNDEDGLNLTLTLQNNIFTMKDKENNKLIFQKRTNSFGERWHLKEVQDAFGNKIVIELNTNQQEDFRILKVTDAAGDILTFSYDSTTRLSTITDKSGKVIRFSYNSNYNMSEVTYSDSKKTTYTYNSLNLLTSAKNIDNSHIDYEYYNEKSNRVKSIKEYSTSNSIGNTISITYGNNVTKFTDNRGYSNSYTFNNNGQTISISDFGKDDNNVNNAYGKMYKYGENSGNKNKLVLESQLISINQMQNNLIVNGTFDNALSSWTGYLNESNDGIVNGAMKMNGNANLDKNIYQTCNISGNKGDIYSYGAWVNTNGVPNNSDDGKKINITIFVLRTDNSTQVISKEINVDGSGWQFVWDEFITDSDYQWIRIHLLNNYNANETYFDNIGLFKEEFGQSYKYDNNGNIISTRNLANKENRFEYDSNNNLISSINPNGGKFTYNYDSTNPKKLINATNEIGNKYSFNYDSYGNVISAKVEENDENLIDVKYQTHIENYGWIEEVKNGETSGSPNLNYKMEAIKISLSSNLTNGNIRYQSHVSNIGWQNWVQDGAMAGTTGQNLAMEAIKIELLNLPNYSVKYRAYVEGVGWQNWVQNGEIAGTTGQNKKIYGIEIKIEHTEDNKKYIQTSAEYSSNGNYQTKLIDEVGNVTQYQYNENTGAITKVIDAKNNQTNFIYDSLNRLTNVKKQASQKEYSNTYTYENDMLKTITHNGFSYTFLYDNFGNIKQTKVGNQVLSTNNYEENNGNLLSATYGNNQTNSYNYDRFNRLTKVTGTNGNYQYTYDAKSNVKTIVDSVNNNTQTFTYDLSDRLVKETNTNGFTSEYGYDINSNINTYKYTLTNKNNLLQYNYDKANRLTYLKLNNSITWSNTMDNLSRLDSKKITSGSNNYTTNYTYTDVSNVTNKTTTLLKTIKNGNNDAITYTYDALGNIETIKKGNTLTNKYYYDELNQLIREDSVAQNKTITYEYDVGGNLLNKKEYSYTTSSTLPSTVNKTITYTYGNTNWKDQLTQYNGKQITYDAIGNPLTYDGNTYTWQNGRQLSGISNTAKNQTITYKYNDSGIRTQKTVNGTTTNYYLDGTKVIYEKTGNNVIYYTYDENGRVIALKYNDTQYYYIRNGQNDIIGILDSNLNQIVAYEYDSWGNVLSIKDTNGNNITSSTHIGIINPYRYRSYRYDTETGLYYLQSRYYNPEWGRFINFDNYGGQVGELLSHNGYAYCKNNPVNMIDEDGNSQTLVLGIFAIIVLALTIVTIPPDTWTGLGEAVTTTVTGIVETVSSGIAKITTKKETKVDVQVKTKAKDKEKDNYWQADIIGGNVVIGKPLSFSEARNRVSQGQSIMCSNNMSAWGIAKSYPARVLEPPHKGEGYYWHYHINKNEHNNIHIWFHGDRTVSWN